MSTAPIAVGDGTSLAAVLQAVESARALRPLVPLALATLVDVHGSSYRQPGARLLVDCEQRVLAGAISGGCLEGDVAARAAAVCASGQPVVLRYDLREDLETIWGFGAGCDGIAHVLLEPLTDDDWLQHAHRAMMTRTRPVLATIFASSRGALSHDASSHSASSHDASSIGTHLLINERTDGEPTDAALTHALREDAAAASRTAQVMVATTESNGHTLSVLYEPLLPPVALHLIGAGKSAEAFATIASALGWQVTVIDHREALLSSLRLPPTVQRMARRASEGLNDIPRDSRTAVALLTHVFEIDAAWLSTLLAAPVAYIGVLGSRDRAARLVARVATDHAPITPDLQQRLFAPIGLDLGGESPESIALAGIAEIEAVLHSRPGGFLRTRQSPIHTRTPTPVSQLHDANVTIEHCALPPDERA